MTHAFTPPPRVASFKTLAAFKAHLAALSIPTDCDDALLPPEKSPLGQSAKIGGFSIGNRFTVQPMEGWDGTPEGRPTELTLRRWRNFGRSGAKLIWGGEALAVRHDGRANPRQLFYAPENQAALAELPQVLLAEHQNQFGGTKDLLLGLQLTHSGRFCRPGPGSDMKPRITYRHPVMDARVGLMEARAQDAALMHDEDLAALVEDYATAAVFAQEAGFHFVDLKHCHGYLLHELLSAHSRPGPYGGSFENRTRMLREIVAGIRRRAPGLMIGVRLSA
ncbi:MAG: NADH:flavin oxidoreductase, partial [Deltaproteobacteria bacterium]|nr:NADH:flavin oxidoreductase [Deltaproteobacteria bacterium]